MNRSWLHFVPLFVLALTALIGCNRMSHEPEIQAADKDDEFTFPRLETAEDVQHAVDEATSHPDSIILVHVSWAPMILQQKRFAEFSRSFKSRHPNSELAFRYIACTPITEGYKPLRSLPGWKELEELNNGSSLVHGYGELAWVKNGRVQHVQRPLDFDSPDDLVAKTEPRATTRRWRLC